MKELFDTLASLGETIFCQRFRCEEHPEVQWFVYLLNVPVEELNARARRAIQAAFDIWGDGPLPVCIVAAGPEKSRALLGNLG